MKNAKNVKLSLKTVSGSEAAHSFLLGEAFHHSHREIKLVLEDLDKSQNVKYYVRELHI